MFRTWATNSIIESVLKVPCVVKNNRVVEGVLLVPCVGGTGLLTTRKSPVEME